MKPQASKRKRSLRKYNKAFKYFKNLNEREKPDLKESK